MEGETQKNVYDAENITHTHPHTHTHRDKREREREREGETCWSVFIICGVINRGAFIFIFHPTHPLNHPVILPLLFNFPLHPPPLPCGPGAGRGR